MKGAPFSHLIRGSSGGGAGDDHADEMHELDRQMKAQEKVMDAHEIAGRIYPAKSARLELIDLVKEVMFASYQTGDRVSIPRAIMDRVVGDLEHAVQLLDAIQDARDKDVAAGRPCHDTENLR